MFGFIVDDLDVALLIVIERAEAGNEFGHGSNLLGWFFINGRPQISSLASSAL